MATYNISTYTQLKAMSSHLADDCVLLNNIDASDSETENYSGGSYLGFAPIGASGSEFTGTFDGGGFTISNLYINRPATQYVGLFGKVTLSAGFIKDVILKDFNISGGANTGLLVGSVTGGASDFTISGVTGDGTITGAGDAIGGLCGSTSAVTMYNCYANCNITVSGVSTNGIGGMIGSVGSNTDCTATCGATGSIVVSGTVGGATNIGGFVGVTGGAASTFTSCYSTVAIIDNTITTGAYTSSVGGFVGYNGAATITLCASSGSILSTDTYIVSIGGFAGYSSGSITKCYATGNVDATAAATSASMGGFIGSNACTAINNCYSHGDVGFVGIGVGTYSIGGFTANVPAGITIGKCYSTGYVNQSAGLKGGFCATGTLSKSMASCLWDTDTSGILTTYGSDPAIGKTTAQLILQATTSASPFEFDYDTIWQMSLAITSAVAASNLTIWPSASGDYDKFLEGTKDADSFQTDIPSTNEIRWIDSQESLLIGTAGDEWELSSNKLDTPLSPTNHGSKRQSGHGSAYMQAINVNEVILFADFVGRKIREMSFDSTKDKYVCPDMTSLSEHITAGKIKWMAYQRNPDSILWVGLETGDVRGFVYDREQNVTAWFKVPLGGDAACQSGCVIPGETEDEIYLIVNRTIQGSTVYAGEDEVYAGEDLVVKGGGDKVYLERFAARELAALADCFFVDCGITFETPGADVDYEVYAGTSPVYAGTEQVVKAVFDSTAPVSTITGLDHLNGETVKILADGVVADDAVVSDGEVTIMVGGVETAVSKAQVGLAYTSKLQPMRLVLGDSLGKKTRVNKLVVSLQDTGAAKYGADDNNLHDMDLTEIGITNTSEIIGLLTGEIEVSQSAGFDPLNPIVISSDSPLPLVVRCIAVDIDRTG